MPELDYNLSTGVDQNILFNVRLDTQERNKILMDAQNIPDYKVPEVFIPKHFETDDLLQGNAKLPSLQEAFYSKDPAISKAAANQIKALANQDPTTRGVGLNERIRYQQGQDRFTTDAWYKERQYSMYGFNPRKSISENEDWLHHQTWDNYSLIGQTWRGVGTFAGRTLSKLVTGLVGTVGDIGAIAWNGLQELGDVSSITDGRNNFWADVSNNWLSRQMSMLDQHVKDEWLPTYKALDYDQKGAWNKLFDPYTWQTSFADGAGFLLQFAVPGTIFGKFAKAGKLARGIGEFSTIAELEKLGGTGGKLVAEKLAKTGMTIEEAKNVSGFTKLMGAEIPNTSRFGRFAGNISEGLTGSKDLGGISAHLFNTSMEAVSETKSGFDDTVQDLVQKGVSRDEAIKIASENAPTQFWLNMGILSASNAFENKLLQKAIGNRAVKSGIEIGENGLPIENIATTKLGKFFTENKFGNRIKFYGELGLKSAWWEGYWEENAQTAAQRYAAGRYTRKGDDTGINGKEETIDNRGDVFQRISGFFNQMRKQTIDASRGNDREAADSIMAGVVIGSLGGSIFAKMSGERKELIKDKSDTLARYKNSRDAWLSLNTLTADMYDEKGKIIPEKAKAKAEEINEKLEKMQSVFKRTVSAEDIIDPQKRDALQYQVFADYVKAHILNGTEQELLQRLQSWGNKTPGELALYGVTPEMKEDSSKWVGVAKNLIDKYNKIKDIKFAAPKNTLTTSKEDGVKTYFSITNAIKSIIYDYTALKDMAEVISAKYADLKNELNPFSTFPNQQVYNEKHAELLSLKASLEKEDRPVVKEEIQKKIDILEKEQEERKKDLDALGETKADVSGFLFPKNVDIKQNPIKIEDVLNFLHFQSGETAYKNLQTTYENNIKEYSDPQKGWDFYHSSQEFWEKGMQDEATKKEEKDITEEFKTTSETLDTELKEAQEASDNATTIEDKKVAEEKIKEIEEKKVALEQSLEEKEITVKDEEELVSDEEIIKVPEEPQLATQQVFFSPLAYVTPFKTTNKEAIDATDKDGNKIWWKELVLEHGYDHKLTLFIQHFSEEILKDPTKYQAFIIKDTSELMKERLSKSKQEAFDEKEFEAGAVIIFKNRDGSIVKFSTGETVVFSFNKDAFQKDRFDERVRIHSKKNDISNTDVINYFNQEQKIADEFREAVLVNPSLQIPISVSVGSLGIYPTTTPKNALERFDGFHTTNPIKVVKDVNEFPDPMAVSKGQVLLEIPGKINGNKNTDNGLPMYIPLQIGSLSESSDTPINIRIRQAVQAINDTKFNTREEATVIVQSFLKNLFYVSDLQYFKVIKTDDKFKIRYFRKDDNGKEKEEKRFVTIPLKLLESIYDKGQGKNLSIYEKDQTTGKFILSSITNEEYKEFIHSNLNTDRKVMTVKRGKYELLYTQPVNAYFNLGKIDQNAVDIGEAKETTEEVLQQTSDIKEEVSTQNPTVSMEIPSTPTELEENIRRKKDALEAAKEAIKVGIENAPTDGIKTILENQGKKRLQVLEDEIKHLESLLPKEGEQPSPLEQLRTETTFNQPMPEISPKPLFKVGKNEYQLDFDNNRIVSANIITPTEIKKLNAFFESAHSYTFKQLEINGKNVYLVKYNKLGKFVILDENYKSMSENKELLDNKEYQDFKNCK